MCSSRPAGLCFRLESVRSCKLDASIAVAVTCRVVRTWYAPLVFWEMKVLYIGASFRGCLVVQVRSNIEATYLRVFGCVAWLGGPSGRKHLEHHGRQ